MRFLFIDSHIDFLTLIFGCILLIKKHSHQLKHIAIYTAQISTTFSCLEAFNRKVAGKDIARFAKFIKIKSHSDHSVKPFDLSG